MFIHILHSGSSICRLYINSIKRAKDKNNYGGNITLLGDKVAQASRAQFYLFKLPKWHRGIRLSELNNSC